MQSIVDGELDPVQEAQRLADIENQTADSAAQTSTGAVILPSQKQTNVMHGKPHGIIANDEDDIDQAFFRGNSEALKKLKLNKGEKRALKFLLSRETGGQSVDIDKFLKEQNMTELKNMLEKEVKQN